MASRFSIIRSGEHRSRSSIRTTSESILLSLKSRANCSRNVRTSRGPDVDTSFLMSPSQSTTLSSVLLFPPSDLDSVGDGEVELPVGASCVEPVDHGRRLPADTASDGTSDAPPVANAAIAGIATCFRPRLATRIQFTDFSMDTHPSRTVGPNRLCSPNAMMTELKIADLASS